MDILTAVQAKGVELKKVSSTEGGEWAGPCPICGGRDRFRVWPDKKKGNGTIGGFWCRQCDKGGDLIEFYKWADGMTYSEACAAAGTDAKRYGYSKPCLPKPMAASDYVPPTYQDPAELWREHALKLVEKCHENLMNNPAAISRLKDSRGITAATAERFKIGYLPEDAFRTRESWGLPTEIKESTGKPKKLWIPRGLVIPYFFEGKLLRIRVRRPKEDLRSDRDPRYYFVPGSSAAVMRIDDHQRRAYIVIESELDAILTAQEAGDLVGVVGLGTSSSHPDDTCHQRLACSDILLHALDADEAGEKSFTWWSNTYPQTERWPVPEGAGKDPGEMFKRVDVRSWVLAGLPPAWHVSEVKQVPSDHSSLQSSKEGGANFDGSESDDAGPGRMISEELMKDLPETVRELSGLLSRHRIVIENTNNRTMISEPKGCDWDAGKRISDLIYFNPDCRDYIFNHPDERITGKNLIYPR